MLNRTLAPIALVCLAVILMAQRSDAQQTTQLSPEEIAFHAVAAASNPAARVAAAEDFVASFPKSSKRPQVAKLVSDQLPLLRNAHIAVSLVDRARVIFTSPEELEFLGPTALTIYANGNRIDDAFALASQMLSKDPDDLRTLIKITYLAAQAARDRNLKYANESYGLHAIEIIEKEQRPAGISDPAWLEAKTKLPGLYQQVGIISLAKGNVVDAKTQIGKSIKLNPKDATSYSLLGRLLSGEYEKLMTTYREMPEDSTKQDEQKKLESLLDEVVDAYAHAVALATGKREHQALMQQLVPDLSSYYKIRHNDSVAGLKELIEKYRY
jgi:tetratricopeptide (TPR) repeat protein